MFYSVHGKIDKTQLVFDEVEITFHCIQHVMIYMCHHTVMQFIVTFLVIDIIKNIKIMSTPTLDVDSFVGISCQNK